MMAPSIDFDASPELRQDLGVWRQRALIAGVAGLGASVLGVFLSTDQFFRSYLWSYLFIVGLTLGCLAWLMLQFLSGGAWGMVIRRPAEAATRLIPVVALLFLPIALGIPRLYPWSHPDIVAKDEALRHKEIYLNVPFFLGRTVLYFAGWILLSWLLNKASAEQDRDPNAEYERRFSAISAPGLIFWAFSITFMAVDWVLSVNPHWFSTIFGLLVIAGQGLSGMAFLITLLVLLSHRRPFSEILTPRHLHDLGKLTLAFVMIWAYFAFSQFLIIWSGNLPEEIPWYLNRLRGGWGYIAFALVIGHFALPFALLLSRDLKRNFKLLAAICAFILLMRLVDLYWLVAPDVRNGAFGISWLDLTLPVGLIGLWLYLFFTELQKRPLMPVGDPHLEEALEHGPE
jgi:hypothetical protein